MFRGQGALEYLIIFGVILLALLPIVYLANQNAQIASVQGQARIAINTIISAVDAVYAQGPGAKATVNVFVPQGYEFNESYISGKIISLRFYLLDGAPFDAYGMAKGEVKGKLPTNWGYKVIEIQMTEAGYVLVGTVKIITAPSYFSLSLNPGDSVTRNLVIENVHTSPLSVRLNYTGPSWITLSQADLGTMAPGSSQTVTVTFSVPLTAAGTYDAEIVVCNAEEYASIPISVTIVVVPTSLTIDTDQSQYDPGGAVNYFGSVLDQLGRGIAGGYVTIYIYDPNNVQQFTASKTTNASGGYSGTYILDANATRGWWTINATIDSLVAGDQFRVR